MSKINTKGEQSFSSLYVALIMFLFSIAIVFTIINNTSIEYDGNLNTSITTSGDPINLSVYDEHRSTLNESVKDLSAEAGNYTLGVISFIDFPIKYISTMAKVMFNSLPILKGIYDSTLKLIPLNPLIGSMISILIIGTIVFLSIRLWTKQKS